MTRPAAHRPGVRPVVVVRLGHPRRARTARRMAALGWPHWRICQALGLSRRRLAAVLGGNALWSAPELEMIRQLDLVGRLDPIGRSP